MSNDFRWLDDDDDFLERRSEDDSAEPARPTSARPPVARSSGESLSAAIIRQQRDRPLEELDERLQALRSKALSAAEPETDSPTAPQALYDVDDVLVSPEIAQRPGGVISAAALSKAQKRQLELLTEIVGGQLETDGETVAESPRRREWLSRLALPRLLAALIIFLAVALPFVSADFGLGDLPPQTFDGDNPTANRVFSLMDSLTVGDWVLVGYEYGPTAAGELDVLADLLLRQLFSKGVKPIIVSSNPIAVVHAQNVIEDIRLSVQSAGLDLEANRDYYLLRYLTGGALGLRDLSQNFGSMASASVHGEPTQLDLTSLDEMALMLLIAERAEDIRNWAEQVAPATSTVLVAATGYAAQPLAEPYVHSAAGIAGLLVGIRDAYTYGEMAQARARATPPPTAILPPTATPQPTSTAQPTATSQPTATAQPTATPPPTSTAQPTVVPQPTAAGQFTAAAVPETAPNRADYVLLRDRRQEVPRLDAVSLGTLAAVLMILSGNVYLGLRAALRGRTQAKP